MTEENATEVPSAPDDGDGPYEGGLETVKGQDTKGREGIYPVVHLTDASRLFRILIDSAKSFLLSRSTSCPA
jgi:hypothetical protein